jgi:hypothetical protein
MTTKREKALATKNDRLRRTKDKGITRRGILGLLTEARGIPELKTLFRRYKLPMDVSVETALKNAIADGFIERVNKPYSAYDAILYKIKGEL